MIIKLDFPAFQTCLKHFQTIVAKSPLAKSEDAKDLGGLLTADDVEKKITIEVAIKGFYLSAVLPGEIQDPGSVVIRMSSITALKVSLGDCLLSCTAADKVMKLKSGRFKADIPIRHEIDDITSLRPESLVPTHSIHSSKLNTALKCLDLDAHKGDILFAKFIFDSSGLTVWDNGPSTAALYTSTKSAFDETLEIVLPVDFISSYISKISGRVHLSTTESLFQFTSDEINLTHPLREADVYDIKSVVKTITEGNDFHIKFITKVPEAIDCITSVLCFAPDDQRMNVKIEPKKNLLICKTISDSGEGENAINITEPEGKAATKGTECSLNCKTVLKLLDLMKIMSVEDVVWFVLNDRIVLQSKDGTVTYICGQME